VLLSLSLSLILAGALGNLIDRLLQGQVVDFILAHWNDAQFPAFNVADSAITIGAALMLLDAFTDGRRRSN
jgi:signal peptidase II